MTDPSTLAGELSAAAAECVRYMGKYPDIWRGTRELPAELHTHGLVGNEAGVLTPLGLAVAKHLETDNG